MKLGEFWFQNLKQKLDKFRFKIFNFIMLKIKKYINIKNKNKKYGHKHNI
jgi:hypothetical protein